MNLLHEIGADAGVACIIGERAHETSKIDVNRAHTRDALVEAVRSHLPLMPVDEDRVDGHETKLAPHAQCCKQCRFAETNHGDVDRTADFQKAGLLEVTDDEGVVSLTLRVQSIADGLRRAAKFRQRMEQVVGRIEAMDLEPDAGTGGCVQQRLEPLDVGRLLDRMDEALIPQPGGTGRFGHTLSPSINTARTRVAAMRLIASGLRTSRQAPIVPGPDVTKLKTPARSWARAKRAHLTRSQCRGHGAAPASGVNLSTRRSCGNAHIQISITTIVPRPPISADGTAPSAAATAPARNSPSEPDEPVNIELTASTRPSMS